MSNEIAALGVFDLHDLSSPISQDAGRQRYNTLHRDVKDTKPLQWRQFHHSSRPLPNAIERLRGI